MKADIEKLLTDSGISIYRISKDTGIAESSLRDYAKGVTKIGNMKLDHAITLHEYYLKNFK